MHEEYKLVVHIIIMFFFHRLMHLNFKRNLIVLSSSYLNSVESFCLWNSFRLNIAKSYL